LVDIIRYTAGLFMPENVIVIGGGPAGLSAALYAAREEFKPLVIAGSIAGGQLLMTTVVDNYPGYPDGIMGPELVEKMRKQAERFGARIINEDVIDVDFTKRPFKVITASQTYEAKTVIIATGASPRLLGIKSEMKFMGTGVSTCATCDGAFFKGKDVIVVGGGDTAMEDASFLTRFCTSVTIIHRKDAFKASKIMQDHVKNNPKIKIIWDSVVDEILGTEQPEKVTGVRIKNLKNGKTAELVAQGVFIAIGYVPSTKFLQGKLELDEHGYIVTRDDVMTDIEGIFVAGDNADKFYRQASTASAEGVKAALRVREYLQNNP
jgi:thioredoxin reductase (NADPH)